MKNIAVGSRTFNESSNSRGDFQSRRLSSSSIPRGLCTRGCLGAIWAARYTLVRMIAMARTREWLTRSSALTLRKSTPTHDNHGR